MIQRTLRPLALACVLLLGSALPGAVSAAPVVVTFDNAPLGTLRTGSYSENGFMMQLLSGH